MSRKPDTTAGPDARRAPGPLLRIEDLEVVFPLRSGSCTALDGVSLDVYKGESLGIVGESGCGKSTLAFSIMGGVPRPGRITRGRVLFRDSDLLEMRGRELRDIRGKRISMIFQDPMTSLNPLLRIDRHIVETIRRHERGVRKREARRKAEALLMKLGIVGERLFDYPHQLSGGMRQRIMIGLGLCLNAEVLIADEPTTSLDVIVEAQFIDLLKTLKREFGLTLILITHNMGLVAQISDRIVVMYGARVMEVSGAAELFKNPLHPYTEGLLRSVPNIRLEDDSLVSMPGFPPDLADPPPGCRFAPRCRFAFGRCRSDAPPLFEVGTRKVSCFRYDSAGGVPGSAEGAVAPGRGAR